MCLLKLLMRTINYPTLWVKHSTMKKPQQIKKTMHPILILIVIDRAHTIPLATNQDSVGLTSLSIRKNKKRKGNNKSKQTICRDSLRKCFVNFSIIQGQTKGDINRNQTISIRKMNRDNILREWKRNTNNKEELNKRRKRLKKRSRRKKI